jgi:hypothetical protein
MITHIYRPDLIPHNLDILPQDEQSRIKANAKVPLYYNDGFPATRSGGLFWDRLEHEGGNEFMLFRQYLEMSQDHGFRSIQILARGMVQRQAANARYIRERHEGPPEENIFLDIEGPSKQITVGPPPPGGDIDEEMMASTLAYLRQVFVMYFWRYRAEAFDLVGQAAVRKIRSSRAILLEDKHYTRITSMVEKAMARFDRFTQDDMDNLDPSDTTKILKDLIQLQRVAIGLPAAAPSEQHLPSQGEHGDSVEDHLRAIHRRRNADTQNLGKEDLLGDEDIADLAQELTMRMLRRTQGNG